MTLAQFRLQQVKGLLTASGVVAVTPHNTNPIVTDGVALAFRVGVGGTVAFTCPDGSTGSITAADKEVVQIPVTIIASTGTTATGIVAYV